MALERDDIVDGLRELAKRVASSGMTGVSIRIVGGAALRLAYFERQLTVDIDARIEPYEQIRPLVLQIARERNWPDDWLNDEAKIFIPDYGRAVDWRPIYDTDSITISVASLDALLAMKLHAAQGRPGRDTDDVAKLLRLAGVAGVQAAEEHYESFYPGDALSARTVLLLESLFRIGLPPVPQHPPDVDFGSA